MGNESEYEKIKKRTKRCVCKQCGSDLEVRMVIFCQYGGQGLELYCPKCERVEYGIEREIYRLAKTFVKENEFNYFVDMAEDERNEQLNIAKVGELCGWVFDKLGLCDENGMTEIFGEINKKK